MCMWVVIFLVLSEVFLLIFLVCSLYLYCVMCYDSHLSGYSEVEVYLVHGNLLHSLHLFV